MIIGEPDCHSTQKWEVLHYAGSVDRLILLPNGKLRHYVYQHTEEHNDYDVKPVDEELTRFHDYEPGQYCLDKVQLFFQFVFKKINVIFFFRVLKQNMT